MMGADYMEEGKEQLVDYHLRKLRRINFVNRTEWNGPLSKYQSSS